MDSMDTYVLGVFLNNKHNYFRGDCDMKYKISSSFKEFAI